MRYPFPDKFNESDLNRAEDRESDTYPVLFDAFMHFFTLANPANQGQENNKDTDIFGEKDTATRCWLFQFTLKTDGVSTHLLYKNKSR